MYGKDKLIKEKRHDAYRARGKQSEPAQCTDCGAWLIKGRWTWEKKPGKAAPTLCPACRRIADRYPAGYIELKGAFFSEHREEINNLIQNIEKLEKGRYPLERIMQVRLRNDSATITTTGVHIARRIGEALARAYQGELTFQYSQGAKLIRVRWER